MVDTTVPTLGAVASFPDRKDEAMNQRELNRAVARATGESVSEIASRGFVPLTERPYELEDSCIDWDVCDLERIVAVYPQRNSTRLVGACH